MRRACKQRFTVVVIIGTCVRELEIPIPGSKHGEVGYERAGAGWEGTGRNSSPLLSGRMVGSRT
jgi:hypothetical protein